MKISIGPALFEWGKQALRDFYRRMAFETPADILYMGEVVCSKRNNLDPEELVAFARELQPSGKQIVFSSLGLVMTEGELATMRRLAALAREEGIWLEANDLAGLAIGEGQPLAAGPHITTYNTDTLAMLAEIGVKRAALPVELPLTSIAALAASRSGGAPEIEVFAHGKLPLTFSARCYTARAFHLPKSNCQYRCGDFPDGMTMSTQEGMELLTLNGVETMSDAVFCGLGDLEALRKAGVDILRLSPQSRNMKEIVEVWHQRLLGRLDGAEALARLRELNEGRAFCNGYLHGRAGLDFIDASRQQATWGL
ncbi:MAG: U32 family peptidase [Magnetococcales bacterium]|nr:U32 family peptidase [Magnetococcales bacterium]